MENYIKGILSEFEGQDNQQKIVGLFRLVRDIPYGGMGSRDPEKVWELRTGTCSGKHLLLGKLYEEIGINVKFMMCLSEFNFLKDCFPDNLKKILEQNKIPDYHNYLRISYNDKLVDVDVTFDLPLKKFGFPVNVDWDGTTNCIIAFRPIEIYEVSDLIHEKMNKLNRLPKETQEIRIKFIDEITKWMKQVRN